jgi:hypothetical protein
MVANMSVALSVDKEVMPTVDPTNSARTTPISENATALGNAAKVQERAFGTRTFQVICEGVAPRVLQKSMMCFSMLQLPLNVLKNTRKKTMNHAVTTLDASPSPKIIVISGTMAIRGRELKPVMKGFSTLATRGFCESRRPNAKPLATDTIRPMVVASSVDHK